MQWCCPAGRYICLATPLPRVSDTDHCWDKPCQQQKAIFTVQFVSFEGEVLMYACDIKRMLSLPWERHLDFWRQVKEQRLHEFDYSLSMKSLSVPCSGLISSL